MSDEPSAGPPGSTPPGERLESWKEIASYLGRTPRTVQRWERQEGLPVHRLVHDKLGSVYAYRSELDTWWKERKSRLDEPEPAADAGPAPEAEPARTGTPRRRRRLALASMGVALAAVAAFLGARLRSRSASASEIRIAVLPFANLSGDAEQEYLSDGLTEEMITELGRLHPERLGVIARTSVMRYRGQAPGIDRIGSELGVHYVLEGSVRRAAERVRITVKLVRVENQTQLWADSFERRMGDLLDFEQDVARRVAAAIRLKLTGLQTARLDAGRPGDAQAHEAYLRGRYFWNKRSDEGFRKSVSFFQEAVTRDPGYAQAWSGLADAYTLMANYSVLPVAEAFLKAKEAAEHAITLDPDLAEAHASLAFILRNHDWDFAGAEREFRRALELNPNYTTARFWYAIHLESTGRFPEAREVLARAESLDPLSLSLKTKAASLSFAAGDRDLALAQLRRVLELDPADMGARLELGRLLARTKRYDLAIEELKKALAASEEHPMVVAVLGHVYAKAGRLAEARDALARLQSLSEHRQVVPYYWAVIYAGLGDKDRAIAWLEKEYEERHVGVLSLAVEPEFEGLRADPRFQAIVRRVGLPQ